MNPRELSEWYYLMYLGPGGIALLLLLLSAIGGGGRHQKSHHSPKIHHAHKVTHGAKMSHGPKAHGAKTSAPTQNAMQQTLAWFGVGRVPGLFIWGSALLGWGFFGYWGTRMLETGMKSPALFALPALGIAILGAATMAKLTAEAGAKLLPTENSTATDTVELCGLTGTVVFPIDEARGRVHVYDAYGTLHDVRAVVLPGHSPIARGVKVLVVDFDAGRGLLIVETLP